ncbi:hypothetical protein BU23DRAFT_76436 [Bimuria novae-zelandiae CBS 107.79]|uniref:Uncharacterized protein n=1 Tax=Bimuria novae-zelandiae CBS 107.79 TaxID=1447943 RepID=A0A6A5VEG8_9PLEO|nr:hypothetical protein BU23DRAFT_76436 [Bimuria novae-zelandiae CBS 107.79]
MVQYNRLVLLIRPFTGQARVKDRQVKEEYAPRVRSGKRRKLTISGRSFDRLRQRGTLVLQFATSGVLVNGGRANAAQGKEGADIYTLYQQSRTKGTTHDDHGHFIRRQAARKLTCMPRGFLKSRTSQRRH